MALRFKGLGLSGRRVLKFAFLLLVAIYLKREYNHRRSRYDRILLAIKTETAANNSIETMTTMEAEPKRGYEANDTKHDSRLFQYLDSSGPEKSFLVRKIRIKKWCSLALRRKSVFHQIVRHEEFFINYEYKMVWCNVFKAASTPWILNFLTMKGVSRRDIQKLRGTKSMLEMARKHYYPRPTQDELDAIIKKRDYTSFLIVRDPLERLLSTYRNNLMSKTDRNFKSLRCLIAQVYPLGKVNRGCDPSFADFVSYVIDEHRRGNRNANEHWIPISQFCTPCKVKYKFVLHFENLKEEQDYMLKTIPELNGTLNSQTVPQVSYTKLADQYFSQLSPQTLRELVDDVYGDDFNLFGYDKSFYQKYINRNRTLP